VVCAASKAIKQDGAIIIRQGPKMKTKRIGSLDVSVIGLGTNSFGTDFFGTSCDQVASTKVVHAALDAGITFIDTAEEYSTVTPVGTGRSEEFIGVALGARRNEVVIATKFSVRVQDPEEKGARRIIRAVESSLKRLGTDRIDLLQQHSPDPEVPIDEILEALTRLVRDGKVREIGCSNFTGQMIDAAQAVSATRGTACFVSVQNPYNLLDHVPCEGVLEACKRHGIMMLPCFPLASGVLTGKYRINTPAPANSRFATATKVVDYLKGQISGDRLALAQALEAFASQRGHSLLELAISWLASQPVVASVIAGATSAEQVRSNAAAVCWDVTEEDFRAVSEILRAGANTPPSL
jgi:aryl-alcohol dehydrogenase-like predicted oxidoreductase